MVEHACVVRGPQARVEHDTDRRGSGHHPDRELRIVGEDRSDAHEHGIARGTERVRGPALLLPADPPGVAGRCGDPPVDGLRVLHDHVRPRRPRAELPEQRRDVRWRRHSVWEQRAHRCHVPHHGLLRREVADVARVGRGRQAHDLPHRDAARLERGRLVPVVGHQPDRTDPQRAQARRDVTVAPVVDGEAEVLVRFGGVEPLVLQHVRAELVRQADPAPFVPGRIDKHAAAFGGDRPERVPELDPAVAPQRAERITGDALGVHPDQDVLAVADRAPAQA